MHRFEFLRRMRQGEPCVIEVARLSALEWQKLRELLSLVMATRLAAVSIGGDEPTYDRSWLVSAKTTGESLEVFASTDLRILLTLPEFAVLMQPLEYSCITELEFAEGKILRDFYRNACVLVGYVPFISSEAFESGFEGRFASIAARSKNLCCETPDMVRLSPEQYLDECIEGDQNITAEDDAFAYLLKGVAAYDLAIALGYDEVAANASVQVWADEWLAEVEVLGKCPVDGRSSLYRLIDLLTAAEKAGLCKRSERHRFEDSLATRLRSPVD